MVNPRVCYRPLFIPSMFALPLVAFGWILPIMAVLIFRGSLSFSAGSPLPVLVTPTTVKQESNIKTEPPSPKHTAASATTTATAAGANVGHIVVTATAGGRKRRGLPVQNDGDDPSEKQARANPWHGCWCRGCLSASVWMSVLDVWYGSLSRLAPKDFVSGLEAPFVRGYVFCSTGLVVLLAARCCQY